MSDEQEPPRPFDGAGVLDDLLTAADIARMLRIKKTRDLDRPLYRGLRTGKWDQCPPPILPKIHNSHRWYRPHVEQWLLDRVSGRWPGGGPSAV